LGNELQLQEPKGVEPEVLSVSEIQTTRFIGMSVVDVLREEVVRLVSARPVTTTRKKVALTVSYR